MDRALARPLPVAYSRKYGYISYRNQIFNLDFKEWDEQTYNKSSKKKTKNSFEKVDIHVYITVFNTSHFSKTKKDLLKILTWACTNVN